MSRDIENHIRQCNLRNRFRNNLPKEPLVAYPLPDRPWQKVGIDIFTLEGADYLLVIDYYSEFPELARITGKTASNVTQKLKEIFGIPELVIGDNMPFWSPSVTGFADH